MKLEFKKIQLLKCKNSNPHITLQNSFTMSSEWPGPVLLSYQIRFQESDLFSPFCTNILSLPKVIGFTFSSVKMLGQRIVVILKIISNMQSDEEGFRFVNVSVSDLVITYYCGSVSLLLTVCVCVSLLLTVVLSLLTVYVSLNFLLGVCLLTSYCVYFSLSLSLFTSCCVCVCLYMVQFCKHILTCWLVDTKDCVDIIVMYFLSPFFLSPIPSK